MNVKDAYANIEKIITYGFLPLGIRYKGHTFILKTITDKEFAFMTFLAGDDLIDLAKYRLAYSTYMVDGVNYLEDRTKQLPKLLSFYEKLPTPFFKVLSSISNDIHEKYLESINYLEGFSYTPRSRHLWNVLQGNIPSNGLYHGISGTSNIGINIIQENWMIINKGLDSEEEYEIQFRLSLMVASSFSSKGAKEMGSRFDFHKKELEELRQEICKYGYDKKRVLSKKQENQWAQPIQSREDLVRELNRQMSGDQDKHDLFINEWIKKQEERADQARKAAEERRDQFRSTVLDDSSYEMMESSRLATPEDLEKLSNIKKNTKRGLTTPTDAYQKSNEGERVLKKVSGTVIKNKK